MDRRTLLALIGTGSLATVAGCGVGDEIPRLGSTVDRIGIRLSDDLSASERALVTALVDTTIPPTDTPGAVEAGVPPFVLRMMAEWYTLSERRAFRLGLRTLDRRCRRMNGASFATLDAPKRLEFLARLDGKRGPGGSAEEAFALLKRLTVHGYLNSELIQTKVLGTVIMPGRLDGCVVGPA